MKGERNAPCVRRISLNKFDIDNRGRLETSDQFPTFNCQAFHPKKPPKIDGEMAWNKKGFRHEDFNVLYSQKVVPVHFIGRRFAQSHGRAYIDSASANHGIAGFNEQDGFTTFPDEILGRRSDFDFQGCHQHASL